MKKRKDIRETEKGMAPRGENGPNEQLNPVDVPGPLPGGDVVLYQAPDGETRIDVRLEGDTLWLTQAQMVELFGRTKSVIFRHLQSIFASGELQPEATVAEKATVHLEGDRQVTRRIQYFNLDAVLSVGYRVNSKRGTQFRIWATRTLREHLLRGYTLNEKRLRERGLGEMEQAIALLAKTLTHHALVTDEGRAVLDVVQRYSRTWRLLVQFDERNLADRPTAPLAPTSEITPAVARTLITRLHASLVDRGAASPLFGRERTTHLDAILGAIEQTFDAKPLYPSVQARAAHLLYFVIKDHPFADGNKRIGTFLFLEYLRRHGLLELPDGRPRLANNAMVALALLVAESEPRNKELMIRLILNLLEDDDARPVAESVAEMAGRYVVSETKHIDWEEAA